MAHALLKGRMAFVGEVPWHGLGRRVPSGVDAGSMIKAAGLDWRARKIPATGATKVESRNGQAEFEKYFVVRDRLPDEDDDPVLGIVTPSDELLQNKEAFSFFEPLLRTGARFGTAGALHNGETMIDISSSPRRHGAFWTNAPRPLA
jgi:hypothetical protein